MLKKWFGVFLIIIEGFLGNNLTLSSSDSEITKTGISLNYSMAIVALLPYFDSFWKFNVLSFKMKLILEKLNCLGFLSLKYYFDSFESFIIYINISSSSEISLSPFI